MPCVTTFLSRCFRICLKTSTLLVLNSLILWLKNKLLLSRLSIILFIFENFLSCSLNFCPGIIFCQRSLDFALITIFSRLIKLCILRGLSDPLCLMTIKVKLKRLRFWLNWLLLLIYLFTFVVVFKYKSLLYFLLSKNMVEWYIINSKIKIFTALKYC